MEALIAKVSPILVEFEPESTFDMLLQKQVSIIQVLPTLLRYCELLEVQQTLNIIPSFPLDVDFEGKKTNFAISYLQKYVTTSSEHISNLESTVVHTLSTFIAKFDDDPQETLLIGFLTTILERTKKGDTDFDKEYLNRLCKRYNRRRSSVFSYLILGLDDKV